MIAMKRALVPFLAVVLVVLWAGFAVHAAQTAPSKASPKKTMKIAEQEEAKSAQPSEYVYDPEGKTDPFDPFIVKKSGTVSQLEKRSEHDKELQKALEQLKALKQAKTELQTIPLAAVSLTAIVKADDQVAAMVKGPEGGKGYMLKKGTYIGTNGGVVEEIVDEERMTDLGKQLIRKVVIKEPYLDDNRKISYRNVELKMPGSFD